MRTLEITYTDGTIKTWTFTGEGDTSDVRIAAYHEFYRTHSLECVWRGTRWV